jgi:hypothetical protein
VNPGRRTQAHRWIVAPDLISKVRGLEMTWKSRKAFTNNELVRKILRFPDFQGGARLPTSDNQRQ